MKRFRVPNKKFYLITGIKQSRDGGTVFMYDRNNQAAVYTIFIDMRGSLKQATCLTLYPDVAIRL